ncbi:MAG: DUF2341 domain-containing protein [Kiritimatiellae bacterium]|nr:DUF2341 domain-containing protein [Kiritimatiellia bacterium]MDD5520360.1 DUF2341 domain-containing protein [Kiritimatiellia bacterium]
MNQNYHRADRNKPMVVKGAPGWVYLLAFAICFGDVTQLVQAANIWDGGGFNSSWGTANNWDNNIVPSFGNTLDIYWNTASAARLNPSYINANRTIRSINFNANVVATVGIRLDNGGGTAYILTIGGAGNAAITVDASATANITIGTTARGGVALAENITITHDGSGTLTIARPISGGFALTKSGTGILTLNGANTYSGVTTINDGTISANTIGNSANSSLGNASSAVVLGDATHKGTLYYTGIAIATARALSISAGGGELDNVGLGTITFAAAQTIANSTGLFTIGGDRDVTVNSVIGAGSGGLTMDGSGTLTLTGANTYSGATTINAGVVNIRNATGLGTTAGGVSVASGAALQLQGGITVGAEALTLNGTGVSTDGALRNISGNNTYQGAITIGSATRINSDSGLLTLDVASGNGITGAGQNVTFGGEEDIIVADPIATTTGTLTKDGMGTLTLSGANTYSGVTTVNAGILKFTNNASAATTSLVVSAGSTCRVETTSSVITDSGMVFLNSSESSYGMLWLTNNEAVGSLYLAGDLQLAGTWGAVGSGATYTDNNYFSGTGVLTVASGPTPANGSWNVDSGGRWGMPVNWLNQIMAYGANYTAYFTNAITAGRIVTNGYQTLDIGNLTFGSQDNYTWTVTNNTIRLTNSTKPMISVNASTAIVYSVISGVQGFTKIGAGTLILCGANTYSSNTIVSNGTLIVNGSLSISGILSVSNGATLMGTGMVCNVTVGGTIRAGIATDSPGTLRVNSNLAFNAGAVLAVSLNGTNAGANYGQVDVTNSVTLGNATLQATLGYDAQSMDRMFIINNRGPDPVSGTFADLPNDAFVTLSYGGQTYLFQISYFGDFDTRQPTGGNDVVLTCFAPPKINNDGGASNVTDTVAWLNGNLTSTGSAPTTVCIFWGTSDGGTTSNNWATNVNLGVQSTGVFSNEVTGLIPNTLYYYRCFATNAYGGAWASVTTNFTTKGPPSVINLAPSGISTNMATLNGQVTATGGDNPAVYVYWGPSDGNTDKSSWSTNIYIGTLGIETFSTNILGLVAMKYYYRCYASNSFGDAWAPSTTNFIAQSWIDGYGYRITITVPSNSVVGKASITNFVLLVSMTSNVLATAANGGHVENTNGYDIIFTPADSGIPLDHEIERYVATNGELVAWVRIPVLSYTSDTVIYMYYGNPDIAESEENLAGVWANWVSVTHMAQPTTSDEFDSVTRSFDYAQSGTNLDSVAGMIGQGRCCTLGGSNDYLQNSVVAENINPNTWMLWCYIVTYPDSHSNAWSTTLTRLFGREPLGESGWSWAWQCPSYHTLPYTLYSWDTAGGPTNQLVFSNWVFIASSSTANSGGSGTKTWMWNGKVAQSTAGVTCFNNDGSLCVFNSPRGEGRYSPSGTIIDEFRVCNTALNTNHISTIYTNQLSPSTFMSAGLEHRKFTWLGYLNTDWSVGQNWACGSVPTADDNVTFNGCSSNCALTADAVCRSIDTTGFTKTLASGTYSLTVSQNVVHANGTITIGDSSASGLDIGGAITNIATLTCLGDSKISCAGNWWNNGTFSASNSTVTFDGTSIIGGSSTSTFASITITGTLTAPTGTVNVTSNFVNNGTFNHNSGTVGFTGNTAISGSSVSYFNNIILSGTLSAPTEMHVAGNFVNNGTFTRNLGLVVFDGNTAISGTNTTTFYDVTIATTLTAPTGTMNMAHDFIDNGTFNHNAGTVGFTGNSEVKGSNISTFANITISGTLTASSGSMNVASNFVNNGTFNHNSGTIVFTGDSVLSGSSVFTFNKITISDSMTAPTGTMNMSGNFVNNGAFNSSTGTVVFISSGSVDGTSDTTFHNLTLGDGITLNTLQDFETDGTLTFNSATEVITLNIANSKIVTANSTVTFGNSGGSAAMTGEGTFIQTAGTATMNQSVTVTNTIACSFYSLSLQNGILTAPAVGIYGNFTNNCSSAQSIGNLTFMGTDPCIIGGTTVFSNLTCTTPSKYIYFTAGTTQTVAGTINFTASYYDKLILRSTVSNSTWGIIFPGGPQFVSYVDVQDSDAYLNTITVSGGKDSANNNTNWIFRTRFWVGGNGDWSDTNHWSGTSGGMPEGDVPILSEVVIFDENSGGGTCAIDTNAFCKAIFMSTSNTTTVALGTNTMTIGLGGCQLDGATFNGGTGTLSILGRLAIGGGTFIAPSGGFTLSRDFIFNSGTFNHNGATIVFNNNTTISGSSTSTFANITITGTLAASTGTVNIISNFVNNGTFTHNSGSIVFNGDTTISGSSTSTFAKVTVAGTLTAPTGKVVNIVSNFINNGTFNHGGGTVVFNGNTAISGASVSTFANVSVTGALTAPAGTMNVASNFVNSGTFNHGGGTVVFNGDTTISGVSTSTFANITITGALTAPTGTVNVASNFVNNGTFTHNSGTVRFTGVTVLSGSSAFSFNNVTITNTLTASADTMNVASIFINDGTFNHGGGTVIFNGDTTISGVSTSTFANITITGALTAPTGTVNVTSNFVNNGTFTHNSGTVRFTGVTVLSGSSAFSLNNVTIANALTVPAGTINIAGSFKNDGTFNHGGGTVVFDGDTAISGTSISTFANVTVTGALTAPAGTVNVASNFVNNGTFTHNSGTVGFTGVTVLSGSSTFSFNNVTITGTLTALAGTIYVAGNFQNSGTFNHNSGTVIFDGAGSSTISGNTTFCDFICLTGGKNLTFQNGVTQSIVNLTLTGVGGSLIVLRSTSDGNRWGLAVTNSAVGYVDVKDSDASGGKTIYASSSVNSLNNINWAFATNYYYVATWGAYSAELLTNPSFESALGTEWVKNGSGSGNLSRNTSYNNISAAKSGTYFVTHTANTDSDSGCYQDVSLSAYTNDIMAGNAEIIAQGWLYRSIIYDDTRLQVIFYDAGSNEITSSTYDTGWKLDNPKSWTQYGVSNYAIPTEAVRVRVLAGFRHSNAGAGGFDNATCKVRVPTSTDWNKAANWSFTSGGAGGAGVPSATNDACFDANSGYCFLETNASCLSLDTAGYLYRFNVRSNDLSVGQLNHAGGTILIGTSTNMGLGAGRGGIKNSASLICSGTSRISCGGNWINSGVFTASQSTVVFDGYTTISGNNTPAFNNITISNILVASTGTMSLAGNFVNNGTFSHNSGTVNFDGTTVMSGSSSTSGFNNVTISGTVTAPTSTLGVAGNFVNNGTFNHNSGTVNFNGVTVISGSSSTPTFNNVIVSGTVTAPTGTMNVASNFVSNGTFNHNSGTVNFNGTTILSGTAPANFNNVTISGKVTLNSANTMGGSSLVNLAGTLDLNDNNDTIGSLSGAGSVMLGSGTLAVSGSVSTVFSGVFSETGGLTKKGTGTLTLSGNNAYSGPTMVSGGTLQIDGNNVTATGALSVNSGATLCGKGVLGGPVSVAGDSFVSPATTGSVGVMNLALATMSLNGRYVCNISGYGENDKITVSSVVTGTGSVNVVMTGSFVPVVDTNWIIITGGVGSDYSGFAGTVLGGGASYGDYVLSQKGNNLSLEYRPAFGSLIDINAAPLTNQSLPFVESFESIPLGQFAGTNKWGADPTNRALVQSSVVYGGSRAASISNAFVWHGFSDPSATKVWCDWYMLPSPLTNEPAARVISENTSVALYLNNQGHFVVFSNNTWITLSSVTMETGSWVRCILYLDYDTDRWSLYVANNVTNKLATRIVNNYPLVANATELKNWRMRSGSSMPYLDNFGVGTNMLLCVDNNGNDIPDAWEIQYFGWLTNANTDTDMDGVSNIREYLAGTNPTNAASYMKITECDLSGNTSSNVVFTWLGGNCNVDSIYAGDTMNRTFNINAANNVATNAKVPVGFVASSSTGTNTWTDVNATGLYTSRYYNVAVTLGGNSYTNTEEWAMHVQNRPANERFLMCVPIDFGSADSNNLNSILGQQLSRGLHAANTNTSGDMLRYLKDDASWAEYYLATNGDASTFWWDSVTKTTANVPVSAGMAFWIVRGSNPGTFRTNAVFTGRSYTTNTVAAFMFKTNQWTMSGWPLPVARKVINAGAATPSNQLGFEIYANAGTTADEEQTNSVGDQIWIWKNNTWTHWCWLMGHLGPDWDGRWWDENASAFASFELEPGTGYYYYHPTNQWGGTNFVWTPQY